MDLIRLCGVSARRYSQICGSPHAGCPHLPRLPPDKLLRIFQNFIWADGCRWRKQPLKHSHCSRPHVSHPRLPRGYRMRPLTAHGLILSISPARVGHGLLLGPSPLLSTPREGTLHTGLMKAWWLLSESPIIHSGLKDGNKSSYCVCSACQSNGQTEYPFSPLTLRVTFRRGHYYKHSPLPGEEYRPTEAKWLVKAA